jgi:hypothetical protein
VYWKGTELRDIVGRFLCERKDERVKKPFGIHKTSLLRARVSRAHVLVSDKTAKIHDHAIPTWALGHYNTAYMFL